MRSKALKFPWLPLLTVDPLAGKHTAHLLEPQSKPGFANLHAGARNVLLAPACTPVEIGARLSAEVNTMFFQPEVGELLGWKSVADRKTLACPRLRATPCREYSEKIFPVA
jgi:hypothetical protein